MDYGLNTYEIFIFILYNFIAVCFLYVYKEFNKSEYVRYLYPAFLLKVTGGFVFALIYMYYYEGGGDCYFYYVISSRFSEIFYENPSLYFQIQGAGFEEAQLLLQKSGYTMELLRESETFFFAKIQSILNILAFNSYLGLTFINSMISFIATFSLFKFFTKIVKGNDFNLFVICFCIPSVLMWGSGLLKDTLTMSCFNLSIILLYQMIYLKKYKFNIFFFIIFGYIILELKAYIYISFLAWITFSIFYFFLIKSKNPVLKFLIVPYLGIIVASSIYFISTSLLNKTDEYKVDDIYDRIRGFHDYHIFLKGSAYDLGELDYSVTGLLSKFPQAVNVTLFRPYPWEANSGLFFLNSLESFAVFLYFIFSAIKLRTINFFKYWNKNSFVIGAVVFCIFYSFVIGVTTYNFGALSRFKIPMIPIFLFCILYARKFNSKEDLVLKNV